MKRYRAIFTVFGAIVCFTYLGCSTPEIIPLVPNIRQVTPQTISAGATSVTMTVTGTNFTNQAVILWNGTQLSTSMVDANTLVAPISGGSLSAPGTAHVQVENPQSGASSGAVSVVIAPLYVTLPSVLAISTTALPSAAQGTAYDQTLSATGGTPALTWSVTAGSLPSGLTLSPSTGAITGTPTASGTFSFSVKVSDSGSPVQSASAALTISVAAPAPAPIAMGALTATSATVGQAYSGGTSVSGGTAPYVWSVSAGSLPAGLALSAATGTVSGTPTSAGSYPFSVTATDSGNPAQTISVAASIAVAPSALSIATTSLPAGTGGTGYSQTLRASGGTPGYTWSVSAGSLPAGLTLAATTGVISGTPTAGGTWSFTATVKDNGSPAQTASAAMSIAVAAAAPPAGPGTTWYIRPDGGTRYSANMPLGQCDGKHDSAYPGSGTNQPCAFNDFRFMWDDQSYANDAWVMAGGDTVIIRGCAANANQATPSAPDCRIGWDANTGPGAGYTWCFGGGGSYGCTNPTIPAGTAAQHTRILGQNYAACSTGGVTNKSALAQIFGGFGVNNVLNLTGTQYVDVQCIEITEHNGQCITHGSPAYPSPCNTSGGASLSDYDANGILTNNATANVLLQDVSIHGHTNSGIQGPIGGAITLNRVNVSFNGFAGWNFDDGSATPDAAGSSITANYVTMEGNGCNEEYPIVHAFPAVSCYDLNSGGFGDSWSGQQTELDGFTCNHCQMLYNTKDGFIGPHTFIKNLLIENSESIGNMGQQWKWTNTPNATTTFVNNLTVGNCNRLSAPMPGAPSNYNQYLSLFCRAAGDVLSFSSNANSKVLLANNTVAAYSNTVFDMNCVVTNGCGSTPFVYTNNLILGYTMPQNYFPGANGQAPGLFYFSDPTDAVVSSYNLEYGVRNGDACGGTILCSDPLLVDEPAQGSMTSEAVLDGFNFHPTASSPLVSAGTTYSGLPATDYYGTATTAIPVIGAVEP